MKTIQFELTIEETNLVLEALGQMPFARVYSLIGRLQESAKLQLQEPPATEVPVNGASHGREQAR